VELSVFNTQNTISVSPDVFGRDYSESLVHQVVVAYRNAGRAGTKAQLSRSEVSGTTKKFKKQKGGGARHGDYRAPIFVGGGVTFAASPRSFAQKVNRKTYRAALKVILSQLARDGRLKVVQDFKVDAPKTRLIKEKLLQLKIEKEKVVVVTESVDSNLYLATRNYPMFRVVDGAGIDPLSLVGANSVIVTVDSIKKLQEWLL